MGEIMVDPVITPSQVFSISKLIYNQRHTLQKWWKQLLVGCNLGKAQILVLGRSGVGKSVLTSYIHGEANSLEWLEPGISPDVEIKPISLGDWVKIVSIIPGQNSRERSHGLERHLLQNDLEGLIYVGDWGYTDLRDPNFEKQLISDGYDTLEKIRQYHLEKEVEDFRKVVEQLKISIHAGRGPKWLMIAITKYDLFKNNELDAEEYYKNPKGQFYSVLNDLFKNVGELNIDVQICFVSSKIDEFTWNSKKYLPQMTSSNEHREQLKKFVVDLALLTVK